MWNTFAEQLQPVADWDCTTNQYCSYIGTDYCSETFVPTLKIQIDDMVYTLPRDSMMNSCDLNVVKANNNQATMAFGASSNENIYLPEGFMIALGMPFITNFVTNFDYDNMKATIGISMNAAMGTALTTVDDDPVVGGGLSGLDIALIIIGCVIVLIILIAVIWICLVKIKRGKENDELLA